MIGRAVHRDFSLLKCLYSATSGMFLNESNEISFEIYFFFFIVGGVGGWGVLTKMSIKDFI